ncbi:chromosome segregation protein SMC [Halomonas urumqiensis]|uniref:Chromosome partition protein Smc n=1 Tax=Halomonas urumqiensis TaxID=1684789 RepID=A0A2N7UP72_9GAMM|nr:chromosome segregation protein SMC [Halomonas urumqiensis]PMR82234.1 chromosome segregation protein SMC [Halomonas urumqiensis]PTB02988.1 chromosome segregation protein SMC [Halomonas urumqiensis]GHE20894.1 chromosome partition protein Smc [Halomonas urumqiensis]
MRLTSIRLAGFKSFVDPVTVPFDGNMTAIVGPNGCGKSNIIDAVRWVMGESSAKTLRGESMTDVIFNGSTGRKPVGQASIELIFDNRDGVMGGAYAQYAEIAVKRLVTRDAQSSYFFNGQKCRRRDIADLFLGTGLGPRSYAIIGQGMISRLIEARPEELRSTLEEAAGISKYKERRRETENRMRRTQENLERLDDIREELDKQLERLKRQAEAARRYQTLKQEEHRVKGELALLRARALRASQIEEETRVRELETGVEREVLGLRQCETRLEEARADHDRLAGELDSRQASFFETTTAIARIEQDIEHARSRDGQLARDLESARRELSELERLGEDDGERLVRLDERLETLTPEREELAEQLEELEAALEDAEPLAEDADSAWEAFNEQWREASREAERSQDRLRDLEARLERLDAELTRRHKQHEELPDIAQLAAQRSELGEQLAELDLEREALEERRGQWQEQRDQAREQQRTQEQERETGRQARSTLQGELASLEALIQAGLADHDETLDAHLAEHGLADAPRLGESLAVDAGWEAVVSWVLAPWLRARLVAPDAARRIIDKAPAELGLLDASSAWAGGNEGGKDNDVRLISKVRGAGAAAQWLAGIHCVETAEDAWATRGGLAAGESVITPDGLWLGPGWSRLRGQGDGPDALLVSRRRADQVREELSGVEVDLEALAERMASTSEQDEQAESALEACRLEERELDRRRQHLAVQDSGLASRLEHLEGRAAELAEELEGLGESREEAMLTIEASRDAWQQAMSRLEEGAERRERLERERSEARERLASLRARQRPLAEQLQRLALEQERLTTERAGIAEQQGRAGETRQRLEQRAAELAEERELLAEPEEERRERLDELLDRRETEERALNAVRARAAELVERLREDEQARQAHERNLEGIRERLQDARMQVQALRLKAETQDEQLAELGHDAAALTEQLDPNATESTWQTRLEELGERIRRLGAINLAAIEEYDQQAERRDYLEAQHAELSEALETLDRAIRRIDQETRTRFRETFERVNDGLQALFPRVFGGGTAWLTLTGEDLLETGVAIMARPPGKKNSTIHLLSGGEKALTALSMVFAIFQLNPAPFCMLDEVDAPLDDANVGRYAKLVKEMSDSVQFIYITHNKIAMEAAERLMGVTMQEPGVSRLVAVGVDEAAALAEA